MAVSKCKYLILLMIAALIACDEEQLTKSLKAKDVDLLVVEGVLTNENIKHRVRLTHPYKTLNGKAAPRTGALVRISDGNIIYLLTEFPVGSGDYYTPPLRAAFGLVYTLVVQYEGNEYVASDSSIPVETMPPINYEKTEKGFKLNFDKSGQSSNYIDHYVSWSHTDQCASSGLCENRLIFYDLKTADINEAFKPDKLDFNFPLNSIIVRKKFSTSVAFKNFLRSVLSETEWRGGVFDVERANASTNVSNGGLGFFAVSTVVSDTTVAVAKP